MDIFAVVAVVQVATRSAGSRWDAIDEPQLMRSRGVGEICAAFFRFVSRYIVGHQRTSDSFMVALRRGARGLAPDGGPEERGGDVVFATAGSLTQARLDAVRRPLEQDPSRRRKGVGGASHRQRVRKGGRLRPHS